ncbi:MAG: DoxX family protein [Gammaproteobacteria bacterium]|nr:DoxX family protein [Gammaproteobacteria bacterium]
MNDLACLILRLALGGLILFHGVAKLIGGIGHVTGLVTGAGLPAWVAYGVYAGEVIAPLMVIAGWYTRPAAAVIAVNMLFAIGLVHRDELFALSAMGAWKLELQVLFLVTAVAVALLGGGRYALNRR